MAVQFARRGRDPGGEFWGCNAHRSTGCRGRRDVPPQRWDWFGLVRVPVSIRRDAQRAFNHDMEDYLHGYGGASGDRDVYDEHTAYFEQAVERENRNWERIENENISRVIHGGTIGHKLARGLVEASNQFRRSGLARDNIAETITENFVGSGTSTLVPCSGGDSMSVGLVHLDDGSRMQFARTTRGVQMYTIVLPVDPPPPRSQTQHRGLSSARPEFYTTMLQEDVFRHIAEHFENNFGFRAPVVR